MPYTLNIIAQSAEELRAQVAEVAHLLKGNVQQVDTLAPVPREEIKPVITQDRREENGNERFDQHYSAASFFPS